MGYMVRLGLWGPANPSFSSFPDFIAALGSRGMAALELVSPAKSFTMHVVPCLHNYNCPITTDDCFCVLTLLLKAIIRLQGQFSVLSTSTQH